jgi:hypothetical protein
MAREGWLYSVGQRQELGRNGTTSAEELEEAQIGELIVGCYKKPREDGNTRLIFCIFN